MLLIETGAIPSVPSDVLMIVRVDIINESPTVTADWAYVGAQEIVRPAFAGDGAKPITSVPANNNVAPAANFDSAAGIDPATCFMCIYLLLHLTPGSHLTNQFGRFVDELNIPPHIDPERSPAREIAGGAQPL